LVTPRDQRRLRDIESHIKQPIPLNEIPSIKRIIAHRESAFLSKLQRELTSKDNQTLHLVEELLDAGYDLKNIAAAAIQLARAQEKDHPIEEIKPITMNRPKRSKKSRSHGKKKNRSRSDPSSERKSQDEGMTRFTLGAGIEHGVRPRDIVGSIANEANIPGKAIGAISIHQNETYVDIKEKYAAKAARNLGKFWIKGHAVQLVKTS
jgi:ATP-dependent RNA helicase DeaD